MFTVTETVAIARSRHDVFAFLTDPGRRAEWDATVISESLTSPPPVRTGSTVHTRMRMMGREVEYEWQITDHDPPTRMAITSTAGMLPTSLVFDLEDAGAGCRVSATIKGQPEGLMRLVEPMIADTVRATLAEGLGRARQLLEEPPAS
jgi:carbon monoxide dehydrogenase subunit G